MKLAELVALCEKFRQGRTTHDHWRVYTAIKLLELEEGPARELAGQIAALKGADAGDP